MTFNSYPPPPGPPPQQQQEQLRHPPVSDPFYASSTEFGGSAGGDVAAPPALPPPTQYAQYLPPSLTNPYAGRNQSYEPGSSSPSTPRARDSGMFTSAVQRTASPGSAPGRLPSPKFESFGQAIADSTGAVGGHETEPSVYLHASALPSCHRGYCWSGAAGTARTNTLTSSPKLSRVTGSCASTQLLFGLLSSW